MIVQPRGLLTFNYFRGQFPYQLQPTISLPDYAINAAMGNAAEMEGLVPDKVAGCAYAAPIFVPHNQKVTTWTGTVVDNNVHTNAALPNWVWDTAVLTGTSAAAQCFRAKYFAHQTIDVVWNNTTAPASNLKVVFTKAIPSDERPQGFVALLSRSLYNQIPAGLEPYYDIQFKIGTTHYSVKVSNTKLASFRKSTDGGTTWTDIAKNLKTGGSIVQAIGSTPPSGGQNQIPVEIFAINKSLQIKFGGQQVPYHYLLPVSGSGAVISEIIVEAAIFTQFNCEIHPLKWGISASMRSNPQALGFSPQNTPYYYVSGISGTVKKTSGTAWNVSYPSGSIITVTRVGLTTDIEQQYDLELTNPTEGTYAGVSYAARTAAVTRVTTQVDGLWASAPTAGSPVRPRELSETITFDPNALTIRQSMSATLNNLYGQWRGQAGNIAMQLSLGYANPLTPLYYRFTGLCGNYRFNRSHTNEATITFTGESLMRMLSDQIIFAPPLMDGWNHYYAMAFLAQMAGFTMSQLAFRDLVPSDPYSAAAGDLAPYYLPVGEGMRPWTPRDRESTILSLMDYIRKPTGFLLFVDAQGYLRYERWLPPSAATAKRIFTEGGSGEGYLNEFFDFELESSVDDVRNQIMLIGIDPFDPRWKLILNKLEDTASIYAAPGSEPKNYIGYKKPFVWTDSRFANSAFAAEAASNLYAMLRIPGLHARFTTWLQPDIYPMDVVYINEHTSGSEGVPFYVMQVDNHWSCHGGARSTIHGKFLV
jgi:hypothetical protein